MTCSPSLPPFLVACMACVRTNKRNWSSAQKPFYTVPKLSHSLAGSAASRGYALARCESPGDQCHGGRPVGSAGRIWRAGDEVRLQTGHRDDRLKRAAWSPAMEL